MEVVVGIIAGVAGVAIGFLVGFLIRKKVAESKIGSAEAEAKRVLEQSKKDAEARKKDLLLEAKEEALRLRNETERELKERRAEVTRMERRLSQKEENLDRKSDALEKKNEQLDEKLRKADSTQEQIEEVLAEHIRKLEEVAGYSAEQAKEELLSTMESETRHDMAQKLAELEAEYKEEADNKARNILSLAIQRCAADHVAEATISVVSLPSEEMKGRIIGR